MRETALLFAASLLIACTQGEPAPAPESESDRLNTWLDEQFSAELDFAPMRKTRLGIKDDDYARIDDFSEAALDRYLAWRKATTAEMQSEFDYDALDPVARDSYDLWVYQTDQAVLDRPFRDKGYIFNQMFGPHTGLAQFLIVFHKVESRADAEALVERISGVSRGLTQLTRRSRAYADKGVHAPYFSFDFVIDESRKLIAGYPFDETGTLNPVWADLDSELTSLVGADSISADEAQAVRDRAREALLKDWRPAYEALIEWQQADRGNAAEIASGVGHLPNGKAYYERRLRAHTTLDLTADEVHATGLREIERIHSAMEKVKDEIGFEGTLIEFFRWLREDKSDPRLFYTNDDSGRQGYIDAATAAIENIKGRLPDYFGLLPKADIVVKRVEPFREQDGSAQHYFPSTADGSRPGVYYAHLSDMHAMPIPELEVIAYHEGLPGHHMQIAIAKELDGVPEFRKHIGFGAYQEGWGLYAERFSKEIPGTYQDPFSEFGRLNSELWRAVRLVVDTGLHAQGWTEEQTFDFIMQNASLTEPAARSETRRYIVMPGQATGYMIGMLKIIELRERAEAAFGETFDIRQFHDLVLGGGALPLELLERKVDRWIANGGRA